MGLAKQIIRAAAPLPAIEQYERFLFIGPHPDDIEIGAGATAAKLAEAGKAVCFFVCTDGRYGFDHAPAEIQTPDELAAIRKDEAIRSADLLGIGDIRFGGLSDGSFYRRKDLFKAILSIISDFQPEVVFCPDPAVTSECHSDHLNVGDAAKRAACFAPNDGYLEKQLDAIFECHKSQFPAGSPAAKSINLYLKIRAYDFGLKSLHKTAEGFRVLGQTQMHCFPEAGD